jgi:hypothetical protein
MSLKEQGFRYLVSPDKAKADWIHPAEVDRGRFKNWKDCTDMSDEELDRYILGD